MFKIIADPLDYFEKLGDTDAPYVWFSILGIKCLLLNDTRAVKHVFLDNFDAYKKSRFHKGLKPLLGKGIFLSEGDLWKKQRRETAPFFSGRHFPGYIKKMNISAELLTRRLEKKTKKYGSVDINAESMWFTLDVVLRALFDDAEEGYAEDMRHSLGLLLDDAEERIWNLVIVPQEIKTRLYPEYKSALKFLNSTVANLIDKKKKVVKSDNQPIADFVTEISSYYDNADPEQRGILRDQIMSFLLAGHETSANALSWAVFELAKNPELSKEAQAVVRSFDGEALDMESFSQLKSILAIFEESLRLYPPVWTMSRESLETDEIPMEDGEILPVKKGQIVMISPYTLHRHPKFWDKPTQFDPTRFYPENKASINKFAYIPYGAGPRICLGHKFANIEGMIALIHILKEFDFELLTPETDIKPEPLITLRPNGPVNMMFKRHSQKNLNEHKHLVKASA